MRARALILVQGQVLQARKHRLLFFLLFFVGGSEPLTSQRLILVEQGNRRRGLDSMDPPNHMAHFLGSISQRSRSESGAEERSRRLIDRCV